MKAQLPGSRAVPHGCLLGVLASSPARLYDLEKRSEWGRRAILATGSRAVCAAHLNRSHSLALQEYGAGEMLHGCTRSLFLTDDSRMQQKSRACNHSVCACTEVAAWQGAGLREPQWVPGKSGKARALLSPILRPHGNSNQPQVVRRETVVLMTTVKVVVTVIFPLSPQNTQQSNLTGIRITKDAALWVCLWGCFHKGFTKEGRLS